MLRYLGWSKKVAQLGIYPLGSGCHVTVSIRQEFRETASPSTGRIMWLKSAAFVTLMVVIVSIASVYGKEENNQKQEEEEQEELQQSPSVMVDSQKVINNIAQEFVCFSAKPRTVFEDALNPISETTFKMAKQLSPSYLKVYADSSQMELQMEAFSVREEQSELIQITPNGWRAFDKWAQEAGMVPIFVLDYSGDSWKPNSALKVLMVANSLGITNCLWQLGTGKKSVR